MINDNDKMKIWTGNDLGDSGAIVICESLKTNTTLTTLDLSGNEVKIKWIVIIKNTKEWNEEYKW